MTGTGRCDAAGGGRGNHLYRMGTAVPGVKKAPKLDHFSNVRNMETRVRSNKVGRPIVRGA